MPTAFGRRWAYAGQLLIQPGMDIILEGFFYKPLDRFGHGKFSFTISSCLYTLQKWLPFEYWVKVLLIVSGNSVSKEWLDGVTWYPSLKKTSILIALGLLVATLCYSYGDVVCFHNSLTLAKRIDPIISKTILLPNSLQRHPLLLLLTDNYDYSTLQRALILSHSSGFGNQLLSIFDLYATKIYPQYNVSLSQQQLTTLFQHSHILKSADDFKIKSSLLSTEFYSLYFRSDLTPCTRSLIQHSILKEMLNKQELELLQNSALEYNKSTQNIAERGAIEYVFR